MENSKNSVFLYLKATLFFISFLTMAGFGLPQCDQLVQVVRTYGYTMLTTPSKAYAPGAIVYINEDDEDDRGIACRPDESMGEKYKEHVKEDDTMQIVKNIGSHNSMELSAEYLDQIKASVSNDQVSKITLEFTNPKVVYVSAASILQQMRERSEGCKQIINELMNVKQHGDKRYTLFMINSSLQGDLEYKFEFSGAAEANAKVQLEILKDVAGKFRLSTVNEITRSITGKQLYWGVVMNYVGVQYRTPQAAIAQPVKPASSMTVIEPEETADLSRFLLGGVALDTSLFKLR